MPTIASDIVVYIVDYLCDDNPSLKACSLVCKQWTRIASHRLFRSLSLDPGHVYRPPGTQAPPLPLHTTLQSKPRITNSVRDLTIDNVVWHRRHHEVCPVFVLSDVVAIEVMQDILAMFPNLQSLYIRRPMRVAPTAAVGLLHWNPVLSRPQDIKLESLSLIVSPSVLHPVYVAQILDMLSSIGSMSIRVVCDPESRSQHPLPDAEALTPTLSIPHVRHLVLDLIGLIVTPEYSAALSRIADLSHLEALTATGYSPSHSEDRMFNSILSRAANITALRLTLRVYFDMDGTWAALMLSIGIRPLTQDVAGLDLPALSSLNSLRSMHLATPIRLEDDSDPPTSAGNRWMQIAAWQDDNVFRTCMAQLARLPLSVQHITFELQRGMAKSHPPISTVPMVRGLSWHLLNDAVNRLPDLQSLTVLLPDIPDPLPEMFEQEEAIIKEGLEPRLRAMLSFGRCSIPWNNTGRVDGSSWDY